MRAMKIIRQKVEKGTQQVHKSRRDAVWRAVAGLLIGGMLWPAALGRYRPGKTSDKHSIKAINRLLHNSLLYAELKLFYAAILQVLLQVVWTPVILVDVTEIRDSVCALTASLAHDGRGILIYSTVSSKGNVSKRRFKRRFLRRLEEILPPGVKPILVTDAAYQTTWFDDVEEMGWDYVGRVRHRTTFLVDDEWVNCKELHKKAKNQALDLGIIPFPQDDPHPRRLVLAKARKSKGRKRINQKGKKGQTANDKRSTQSAREPWLLATSLSCNPVGVVNIYALRMQIEENYRDIKNKRWGWALDHYKSRKDNDYTRYEILLLIAALGMVVQQSAGCAGEKNGMQRHFQANTIRHRRVISIFVLGRLLLQPKHQHCLKAADITSGFRELCQGIRALERMGTL